MRYRADIYEKLFPRKKEAEKVETCVEGYTPTTDEEDKEADEDGRDGEPVC